MSSERGWLVAARWSHSRPRPPVGHRAGAAAWRRGEAGETLIELIVTIVIMGSAILAILGGVVTMVITSASHRGSVRSGNEAATVAELIASEDTPYQPCTTAGPAPSYDAVFGPGSSYANSAPGDYTVALTPAATPVLFLDDKHATTPTFDATCPAAGDQGTQQMTVTVTAGGSGRHSKESVTFVKRKP